MLYPTPDAWHAARQRRVALFGMSGLGKTHLSAMLRAGGDWFHYSVDFRIGTRYMGEHIVDNFKREAMRTPFLRDLLMSDSIYIASNLSFENLSPLSTYLGKPGDPARGGIPFEEYVARQRQHRTAEIAATIDAGLFASKAEEIYGYAHFIADCSGSLCEVVAPDDPQDPVMSALSATALPVWIESTADHIETLAERFDRAPKPMYYEEAFLRGIWAAYLAETGATPDTVDPDLFIRWGFRRLMGRRQSIYEAMARRWGVTLTAARAAALATPADFEAAIADAIAARA